MDRAILFVDGNNWYYALKAKGIPANSLNYQKLATTLVGPTRQWVETRYYVGQIKQMNTPKSETLYSEQRRFLQTLKEQGVSCFLGRIEKRNLTNELVDDLRRYINTNTRFLSDKAQADLRRLANQHTDSVFYVEKAVDVMIAVDMVSMAINDRYDAAYLLSADGDYTPVVDFIQKINKKVYAVSTEVGRQLQGALEERRFIQLAPEWFEDCRA